MRHPTTEAIYETAAVANSEIRVGLNANPAGSTLVRRDSHRAPLAAKHNLTFSAERLPRNII